MFIFFVRTQCIKKITKIYDTHLITFDISINFRDNEDSVKYSVFSWIRMHYICISVFCSTVSIYIEVVYINGYMSFCSNDI